MSLTKKQALRLAQEAAKRAERKNRFNPDQDLFPKQAGFVLDPSNRVIACCSRRAGKTHAIAEKLRIAAQTFPGSICPYITLTRETAKDILWPALLLLDRKYELGLRFKENTGDVVFPNGSKIVLRGAQTKREIEKLRGPKYPCVVVDEAQAFGEDLLYLLEDVLEPATLDYNGTIALTGTPNAACAGPFYRFAQGLEPGWGVHNWTLLDNPHLPNAQEWLEAKRKRSGWDEQHPTYLREYCGVWIRDLNQLIFPIAPHNVVNAPFKPDEPEDWHYVLGIDLGFNDPTAFVVFAVNPDANRAVVVEAWQEVKLTPSRFVAEVELMAERYSFASIVADTGGFGKGYVEQLKEKHHLPVKAADKANKLANIDAAAGALRNGSIQILTTERQFLDELRLLQWDPESVAKHRPKVDGRFPDHMADAFLYGFRECFVEARGDWRKTAPKPGTPAFYEAIEDELEAAMERQAREGDVRAFWEAS